MSVFCVGVCERERENERVDVYVGARDRSLAALCLSVCKVSVYS